MLPRKQRILLTIMIPVFVLIIIAIILMILLLKTDFMKPKNELFEKYFMQNIDSLSEVTNMEEIGKYKNILDTSSYEYTSSTTIKNTEKNNDSITLNINGKKDNVEKKDYKDIKILGNDQELFKLEYTNQNNLYGIKFDGFKQYISIRNENLRQLLSKFGVASNITQLMPDSIDVEKMINDIIDNMIITEEENKNIGSRYSKILFDNIQENNFSKQTNSLITVNNVSLNTNAYKMTLTEEEYNSILIKVLEELKNDDSILNKYSTIENVLKEIGMEDISFKEAMKSSIDEEIEALTNYPISVGTITVTVYENKGKLVRTLIESDSQRIIIDSISENSMKKFLIESTAISEKEEKVIISTIKQTNNGQSQTTFDVETVNEDKKIKFEIDSNQQMIDKTINKDCSIKLEINNDVISIENKNVINLMEINDIESLNENNNVTLNDMDENRISQIFNIVSEKITPSITNTSTKISDLFSPNPSLNIGNGIINQEEMSEIEKDAFNSRFEVYKGDEVNASTVKTMLSAISDTVSGIEVIDNNNLKIIIDKNNPNSELSEKISNVIKNDSTYKIDFEHDEETKMIKKVLLSRNEN